MYQNIKININIYQKFNKKISTFNIMNIKEIIILFLIYFFIVIFSLWNQDIINFNSPDKKLTKRQLKLISLRLKKKKAKTDSKKSD